MEWRSFSDAEVATADLEMPPVGAALLGAHGDAAEVGDGDVMSASTSTEVLRLGHSVKQVMGVGAAWSSILSWTTLGSIGTLSTVQLSLVVEAGAVEDLSMGAGSPNRSISSNNSVRRWTRCASGSHITIPSMLSIRSFSGRCFISHRSFSHSDIAAHSASVMSARRSLATGG